MNTVGKILVVFVAAASLGFVAFVAAMRNGGPDWKGEMRSPQLQKEFVFTIEPGEKITYTAKHRRSDSPVAEKTPILPEVILKARKRLDDETNKTLQALQPEPAQLEKAIQDTVDSIVADKKGVELREQNMSDLYQKEWNELNTVGDEFSATTIQTQDVLRVAEERREEGYRLANQLDLLRNDNFSMAEQQKVLEDELIRLQGNRKRLQDRQIQLKKQLGDDYAPQVGAK